MCGLLPNELLDVMQCCFSNFIELSQQYPDPDATADVGAVVQGFVEDTCALSIPPHCPRSYSAVVGALLLDNIANDWVQAHLEEFLEYLALDLAANTGAIPDNIELEVSTVDTVSGRRLLGVKRVSVSYTIHGDTDDQVNSFNLALNSANTDGTLSLVNLNQLPVESKIVPSGDAGATDLQSSVAGSGSSSSTGSSSNSDVSSSSTSVPSELTPKSSSTGSTESGSTLESSAAVLIVPSLAAIVLALL